MSLLEQVSDVQKNKRNLIGKPRHPVAKTLLAIVSAILILSLGLILFRLGFRAVVKAQHAYGAPGIDEMEMVSIGGIEQALYFRGQNTANPVILFLHGGPGSPETPFIHKFQYDWEADFTVVHWDQRMAGKTFFANDPETMQKTLHFKQMVADAWAVTQYIQQKLGKEKIIVMGLSWGSVLGSMLVQTHPEAFLAYIGVGQVVNMVDNERVGYEKCLEAARAAGNEKDIAALEALAPYPEAHYDLEMYHKLLAVRKLQAKYGLALRMDSSIVTAALLSPYYTFHELTWFMRDTTSYQQPLMEELFQFDLHDYGVQYTVPVFYLIGENDYQTPITLSNTFFEEIDAPLKRFYTIPDAGHMTMLDNADEFSRVLLQQVLPLISTTH